MGWKSTPNFMQFYYLTPHKKCGKMAARAWLARAEISIIPYSGTFVKRKIEKNYTKSDPEICAI